MKRLNPNSLNFEFIESQLLRSCKIVKVFLKMQWEMQMKADVDRYNEFDDDDGDDDDDDDDDINGEDGKREIFSNDENNVNDGS